MTARNAGRREYLLDATATTILRHGVRRTSIDEIAREARISKGAVYLEFPSKAALIDAAVRREFRLYLADTCALVEGDPQGGRLSSIYRHSITALLHRPLMRAMYEDDGQILSGVLAEPDRYRPRVILGAEFLRELATAGLLRADLDPDDASHVLSLLSVGPLLADPVLRTTSSPPLETTFELLSTLVVTGMEADTCVASSAGIAAFRRLVDELSTRLADDSPL